MLNLKKSSSFKHIIDYLKHVIEPHQMEFVSHTVDAIRQLLQPRKITKLRSYLKLCNAFSRIVLDFLHRAPPN